jgi:hypothetical protein
LSTFPQNHATSTYAAMAGGRARKGRMSSMGELL